MVKFADRFALPFPKSTFGNRFGVHDIENGHDLYGQQGHRGTDFIVAAGTAVPAIANGVVEHVLWSDALGNVIVLRHYLHGPGNDVYSGYCHLSSVAVKVGQAVALGQTVGRSGNTGTASTGPHLHLTLSPDDLGVEWGTVVDPLSFIEQHANLPKPPVTPLFTTARPGEGLWAIGHRSGVSLERMKTLNPRITAPNYLVLLGQKIRVR